MQGSGGFPSRDMPRSTSQRRLAPVFTSLLALALTLGGWTGVSAQSAPHGGAPSSQGEGPKRKMISLVVLSNKFVDLSASSLSKVLDELYPGKFWPPEQQANFVVGGPMFGQFLIKSTIPGAAGFFMLISMPGPYTDFSDFARFIADPSLRRRAEAQRCWLSVDLLHNITTEEEAYRFIAAALAKLAPADAAVLVNPENNAAIVFDDDVRRRLADGRFTPP